MIGLINDPQTSGGLLFSVPEDRLGDILDFASASGCLCAEVVGETRPRASDGPYISFI